MEAAWRAQLIIIVPLRIVRAHRFGQGRLRKERRTKTPVKGDSRKNWEFPLALEEEKRRGKKEVALERNYI